MINNLSHSSDEKERVEENARAPQEGMINTMPIVRAAKLDYHFKAEPESSPLSKGAFFQAFAGLTKAAEKDKLLVRGAFV